MPDRVAVHIPRSTWNEGASFAANAYFRDGVNAQVPATVHYRIDCLTTCRTVREWTEVPADSSVEIGIASSDNAILCGGNAREMKQITVVANMDTDAQGVGVTRWTVENLKGL